MTKTKQTSRLPLSTKNLLAILTKDWKKLAEVQKKLNINKELDKRYLIIKLKGLERKKLIESKKLNGIRYYKKGKEVKSQVNHKSSKSISKEKVLRKVSENPKRLNKPRKKLKIPQKKPKILYSRRAKRKDQFNYESRILKMNKYQKSIEIHKERLRKDPNNAHIKDLLNKAKDHLNKLNLELKNHSYFVCLKCKRVFRSKSKLDKHNIFKHNIRPIGCTYCDEKFTSESDYKAHKQHHKVDLHGFYLKDAIKEVKKSLSQCRDSGDKGLILIHGYHHGQTLKHYFRSKSFIREMRSNGFLVEIIEKSRLGSTGLILKKN
jgi:transcription elongation factor Elf1